MDISCKKLRNLPIGRDMKKGLERAGDRSLSAREKARDAPNETENETVAPDDPCFYDHCSGLFLQDACLVRHRRCLHKLYPCAAVFVAVFPVGLFPRPSYYTEAGAALLASDSGAYACVACFAYAEI